MRSFIRLLSITTVLTLSLGAYSQSTWTVPEAKKKVVNPVKATPENIKAGQALYNTHCKSCHGDPGKNNGLPLTPKPVDPMSAQYQKQTDGEIFYKMQTGRGAMPNFKETIKDNDKWAIINYVKSLKKGGKTAQTDTETASQPEVAAATDTNAVSPSLSNVSGNKMAITLTIHPEDSTASIYLSELSSEGHRVAAAGVEVGLYVKRTFGNLPIFGDDVPVTDANGVAIVKIPKGLPGDTVGNLNLIASVINADQFGKVEASAAASLGSRNAIIDITDQSSLWGRSKKAPSYLLITYFTAIIIAFGTMGYVVKDIASLRKYKKTA